MSQNLAIVADVPAATELFVPSKHTAEERAVSQTAQLRRLEFVSILRSEGRYDRIANIVQRAERMVAAGRDPGRYCGPDGTFRYFKGTAVDLAAFVLAVCESENVAVRFRVAKRTPLGSLTPEFSLVPVIPATKAPARTSEEKFAAISKFV